jgi:hypothetical protein
LLQASRESPPESRPNRAKILADIMFLVPPDSLLWIQINHNVLGAFIAVGRGEPFYPLGVVPLEAGL